MILTTLDILYIVLAIGIGMVCLSLTMFLFEWVKMMKKANKISGTVEDITNTVNTYVRLPSVVFLQIWEWWNEEQERQEKKRK